LAARQRQPGHGVARRARLLLRGVLIVGALAAATTPTSALISEPAEIAPLDPAPCRQAELAHDHEAVIAQCGAIIDHPKTPKADRVAALLARAAAFQAKQQFGRALSDYDAVLALDDSRAELFNRRGELRRQQGDRRGALDDFIAALKRDPGHEAARSNQQSLTRELERIGAQLALKGKPSFDCARTHAPVEKAICADLDLADLDREIATAFARRLRAADRSQGAALRRTQQQFLATRASSFGRPGFDLRAAMTARLRELLGNASN
jgi:tetratricopeptide (TPR) repeat protein